MGEFSALISQKVFLCLLCLFVAKISVAINHKGERLFTRSLAVALGVRGMSRVGCFYQCDASMVMTSAGQTFQKYFYEEVSEDLLDYAERIFLDKLVATRLRHTTQLHFIISRTQHLSRDREWNKILLALVLHF